MILLLQVRSDPIPEVQEQHCFLEVGGLDPEQVAFHNLVHRPHITWNDVAGFDVLLVGGAGVHSATETYDFTRPLEEVVLRWLETGRPFLGSCWGHHFLARVLQGELVTDPEREEVGTFDITVTDAGRRDPLFQDLPDTFPAQLGHHDRVAMPGPDLHELAYSERCRFQAVRYRDLPVYGTQFHCEMEERHIRERLAMYQGEYLPGVDPAEALDRILRPGPDAPRVLRRFFELYG